MTFFKSPFSKSTGSQRPISIPVRFEDAIFCHIIGNILQIEQFSLLLCIHGPTGHGKSYQISALLDSWEVKPFYISGSELEGGTAGGPAQYIREIYMAAHESFQQTGRYGCIVIDDIDAGIGNFGNETTYTVNRQIVSALLMNLADKPTFLNGRNVVRTPIILTANRLETLYEPLRRPGRMASLYWVMELAEMTSVVSSLFSSFLSEKEASQLLRSFPNESPAFFQQVRSQLVTRLIMRLFSDHSRRDVFRRLSLFPVQLNEITAKLGRERDAAILSTTMELAHNLRRAKGGVT